jgi:hypothetical protein
MLTCLTDSEVSPNPPTTIPEVIDLAIDFDGTLLADCRGRLRTFSDKIVAIEKCRVFLGDRRISKTPSH